MEKRADASKLRADYALTTAFQEAVADVFKAGKTEELTVKRMRAVVEKQFELAEGYFKNDLKWNKKSKEVIEDASDAMYAKAEEEDAPSPASNLPKPKGPLDESQSTASESTDLPTRKAHKKRSSSEDDAPKVKKRQKTSTPDDESSELSEVPVAASSSSELESLGASEVEDAPVKKAKPKAPAQKKGSRPAAGGANKGALKLRSKADETKVAGSDDESEAAEDSDNSDGEGGTDSATKADVKPTDHDDAEPESDMSVLIDDGPAPKKRKRQKSSGTPVPKTSGKTKAPKAKENPNLDPQEAEIKRLQSWLLKCGVRKLWHRELASYDTPRAKITHLKKMLHDVGLEGRFSVEKANRIKEARELQAEVEAVQASAKRWGNEEQSDGDGDESDDADEEQSLPKPLLARNRDGRSGLDFLGSDDGEETD